MSTLRVNNLKPRSGSTVTIAENNTLAVTGIVSVTSGGSLEVAGSASVGGAATITGSVDVQGSLKSNTLTPLTGDTVTIPSGRFLSVGGGVTVSNGGNLDITGGFTVGGATTITGSVDVQGSLKSNTLTPLTGNTVTIPSGQFVNVGGGITVTNAGTFTVSGPTEFQSGAVVTGVVTFTEADLQANLSVSSVEVGSNIKLGNAGVITATSFSGDGSGLTNVSPFNWATKTSNYTALAKDGLFVNTSSGPITITLPSSPATGDYIHFLDLNGTFATNNLTVARNGNNIIGVASDLVVDINNSGLTLVYTDATNGWKLMYF